MPHYICKEKFLIFLFFGGVSNCNILNLSFFLSFSRIFQFWLNFFLETSFLGPEWIFWIKLVRQIDQSHDNNNCPLCGRMEKQRLDLGSLTGYMSDILLVTLEWIFLFFYWNVYTRCYGFVAMHYSTIGPLVKTVPPLLCRSSNALPWYSS